MTASAITSAEAEAAKASTARTVNRPVGLLAELTHRCPLACPYCSNPLELDPRQEELDTESWKRVFSEAAALGVLHIHLSGGEPAARRDLVELVAHCRAENLYTNLITSGIGLPDDRIEALADAGLDHVQLSIQDVIAAEADAIGGYEGGHQRKLAVAAKVVALDLPLTVNTVIHRRNVGRAGEMVRQAIALGARRVEIAHTQYYGWAKLNHAALLPTREQTERAVAEVEALRKAYEGSIVIDHVVPDYHARYPKACMGGWAKRTLNVTPRGLVLPCHGAQIIPDLKFWTVREQSLAEIWLHSRAFNAFRGTEWMKEPCASCERREIDYGGCRCQAMAIAHDAAATDPVCARAPQRAEIDAIVAADSIAMAEPIMRGELAVKL